MKLGQQSEINPFKDDDDLDDDDFDDDKDDDKVSW